MIQNDLSIKHRAMINDEIWALDRLVPYMSRIYENLFKVLEGNKAEELRESENFFKDESYVCLI